MTADARIQSKTSVSLAVYHSQGLFHVFGFNLNV